METFDRICNKKQCVSQYDFIFLPLYKRPISVTFLFQQLQLSSNHVSLCERNKYKKVTLNRGNHKSLSTPVLCKFPPLPIANPTSLAELLTSFNALKSSFITLYAILPTFDPTSYLSLMYALTRSSQFIKHLVSMRAKEWISESFTEKTFELGLERE